MSPKRFYWVLLGMNVLLAVAIIGGVVAGDKLLKKQADSLMSKKLESAVLEQQQSSLTQAKRDLQQYAELKQISKQIVPQDKDQALTTREIITLANKAGVHIGSVGFPSSTLGNAQPKATTSTSGSGTTPSSQPATSTDISQAKPVTGLPELLELPITVVSDPAHPSGYSQLVNFLSSLENNRRTAQVSQISIQPDSKDSSLLNFTLTLSVYLKP